MIVDAWLSLVRDMFYGDSVSQVSHLAVGTGTNEHICLAIRWCHINRMWVIQRCYRGDNDEPDHTCCNKQNNRF